MHKATFGQSASAPPAPYGQAGERRAELAFLDPASPGFETPPSHQPRGVEAAGAEAAVSAARLGESCDLEAPKGLRVEDDRGPRAAKTWPGGGRTGADLKGWLIAGDWSGGDINSTTCHAATGAPEFIRSPAMAGDKFLALRRFKAPFDAGRTSESVRKRLKVVLDDCSQARVGAALH